MNEIEKEKGNSSLFVCVLLGLKRESSSSQVILDGHFLVVSRAGFLGVAMHPLLLRTPPLIFLRLLQIRSVSNLPSLPRALVRYLGMTIGERTNWSQ